MFALRKQIIKRIISTVLASFNYFIITDAKDVLQYTFLAVSSEVKTEMEAGNGA